MSSQPSQEVKKTSAIRSDGGYRTTENFDLSTAFYDTMFGKTDEHADKLNELEQKVCNEIDLMLEHHSNLASLVPPLPEQLIEITNAINDEMTDFNRITETINKDVALAGEVIKMANSPYFRRTKTPVESLSEAVPLIGLTGITNIVTTVLSQRVMSVAPIYFRFFGQQIWTHSLECAKACQNLAGRNDPRVCYFLGLIHDVGKIAVFTVLVDCLKSVNPDSKPGGKLFKRRMTDYSLWLSWRIAEDWNLPESMITALGQQRLEQQDGLGTVLYQGNLCSETHMLIKAGNMSFEDGKSVLQNLGLSEESIFSIYDQIETAH